MRTEGWGVIRPGNRIAHYYRDMTSLCRRVGFYTGPLDPDDQPSPDDCKACRRELAREAAKQGAPERTPQPQPDNSYQPISRKRCRQKDGGYICLATNGHSGPHMAYSGAEDVHHTWGGAS